MLTEWQLTVAKNFEWSVCKFVVYNLFSQTIPEAIRNIEMNS